MYIGKSNRIAAAPLALHIGSAPDTSDYLLYSSIAYKVMDIHFFFKSQYASKNSENSTGPTVFKVS